MRKFIQDDTCIFRTVGGCNEGEKLKPTRYIFSTPNESTYQILTLWLNMEENTRRMNLKNKKNCTKNYFFGAVRGECNGVEKSKPLPLPSRHIQYLWLMYILNFNSSDQFLREISKKKWSFFQGQSEVKTATIPFLIEIKD